MRTGRKTAMRAFAGFGAAFLMVAVFTPSARARVDLSNFGASSLGRGVDVSLGPQEIVIQPLIEFAAPFTRTQMNSIPQSDALAGVLFPGDLPLSVLDEEGTAANAGLPAAWPFTLHARLDPDRSKQDRDKSITDIPATQQFGLVAQTGHMRALADPD